jgi:DNA processing protein
MNINKLTPTDREYPDILSRLASPPKQLFYQGSPLLEVVKKPTLAIIGSRSITPYGNRVTTELAADLARQGVVIISGLALGVDAVAHQAALSVGGQCIAVLPSPIQHIVPITNRGLAAKILDNNGLLVSEYGANDRTYKQNFIARNRIMAGLADAVLITEATLKSGSLHTARFALEQGIEVMAVPGDKYSLASAGTNNLIKSGATPITDVADVLAAMNLQTITGSTRYPTGSNQNEQTIIDLIIDGHSSGDLLLQLSKLAVHEFNQALTKLEITGKIRALGGNTWAIR